MVMLSIRDCFTRCRSWGESLAQWPVIFLRRSTAESWRTLGVLAVRRWWIRAGITCGSLARRLICSSACRRASLSGIKNWIRRSSRDWAIRKCLPSQGLEMLLYQDYASFGSVRSSTVAERRQRKNPTKVVAEMQGFLVLTTWILAAPDCIQVQNLSSLRFLSWEVLESAHYDPN